QERNRREQDADESESERIAIANSIQLVRDEFRHCESDDEAGGSAKADKESAFTENHREDTSMSGTESEADANLAGALLDAVGNDGVQAGGGEEQGGAGKGTDEQQTESTCRKRGGGNFIHRSNRADGDVRIDGADLGADRWFEGGRGSFQNQ